MNGEGNSAGRRWRKLSNEKNLSCLGYIGIITGYIGYIYIYREYSHHLGYITGCLGDLLGDEILPSYMGIITSHDTRIPSFNSQDDSWKHILFFWWLNYSNSKRPPSWISRMSPSSTGEEFTPQNSEWIPLFSRPEFAPKSG